MGDIGNDEAMGITIVASNSHGTSAICRVHSVRVDTQVDLAVIRVDETSVACVALI